MVNRSATNNGDAQGVPQVSSVAGLEHLGPFQLDRTAEVLEQPGTAVQDHRGDVQA